MIKHKKQSKKTAPQGSIRIIAGKHRGRKLPVLTAEGLRPTTDRVKETVFNWLMPYIQDSKCLDCFAGAGSLGFEAISRGASSVRCIELDKNAARQLTQNKTTLAAENLAVEQADALKFLASHTEKYSIVFIDPPFRHNLAEKVAQLVNENCLTEDALVYVEMEKDSNTQQMPSNWRLLKEKTAGQVISQLYQA